MLCKILKTFPGSQDGTITERFEAGTEVHLTDYLMAAADPSWFQPVEIENKAVATDGRQTGRIKLKKDQVKPD
jgi:hypothetical protein